MQAHAGKQCLAASPPNRCQSKHTRAPSPIAFLHTWLLTHNLRHILPIPVLMNMQIVHSFTTPRRFVTKVCGSALQHYTGAQTLRPRSVQNQAHLTTTLSTAHSHPARRICVSPLQHERHQPCADQCRNMPPQLLLRMACSHPAAQVCVCPLQHGGDQPANDIQIPATMQQLLLLHWLWTSHPAARSPELLCSSIVNGPSHLVPRVCV